MKTAKKRMINIAIDETYDDFCPGCPGSKPLFIQASTRNTIINVTAKMTTSPTTTITTIVIFYFITTTTTKK